MYLVCRLLLESTRHHPDRPHFPTRRSSELDNWRQVPQDTQALTPPPPAKGLDEAAVLARVGGNRDTLRGLVEVFYQDCNNLMADLHDGVKEIGRAHV